jgi:Putative adhesin
VLLILWGLIKVFEHYRAQQEGYETSGIGAGGVVFIVFLILFGVAATGASRMDWSGVGFDMGSNGYTFQTDLEQDFPDGASFKAIANHGDVVIRAWDEKKVKVHVSETVRGKDEASAKQVFENNKPTLSAEGNMVTLRSGGRQEGPKIQIGFWTGPAEETNLEIYLPRQAMADLELDHSDLAISDREANLKISSDHGDISLRDIKGNVELSSDHGDTSMNNVTGNVRMSGGPGDLTISNLDGALTVNSERFSDMSLSKISKGVHFTSPRTDLDLGKLDGHIEMDEGDLSGGNISGGFKVNARNKDISLSGVSGDVAIDNSHGDIELQLNQPLGNVDIKNQNASVHISLPESAAFQLEATTQGGDIDSQINGISVSESGSTKKATGGVGSNGPKVRIETEHADIEISRGMSGFTPGNFDSKTNKFDRKMQQKSDQMERKMDQKSRELEQKMDKLGKKPDDNQD